ncbi:hypothetical protein [Bacillus haynesii]|uniref:hypothetical protein n=1 Tax=Bacillus haynesii TaxID=1925021 RepID=UPI0035D78867
MSIEELGYQVREYFDKYYWDEIVQVVEIVNSYGGFDCKGKADEASPVKNKRGVARLIRGRVEECMKRWFMWLWVQDRNLFFKVENNVIRYYKQEATKLIILRG